ncbi:MAG: hypothetical protein A3F41_06185 [Coxiella sp. RIFCSPHIGHO2_12_FULL_44_14]|nr:MAG: hypothetical protein A3F41_06185 [Coxiella sp. RIFCSPHIGHO2_12_FULL_44_14]
MDLFNKKGFRCWRWLAVGSYLLCQITSTMAVGSLQQYPATQHAAHSQKKSLPDDFAFHLGGYFQEDGMSFDRAPQLQGNVNWRAGRVGFWWDNHSWLLGFDYDFSDTTLYDAYVTYQGDYYLLMMGQFSPIFGLENTTNIPDITFLELSLPVFLWSTPYVPGIQIGFSNHFLSVYGSVTGPHWGSVVHGRIPYAEMISVILIPVQTTDRLVYFSVSGWQQGTDSGRALNFSPGPELVPGNNGALIDTGLIDNADYYRTVDGAVAGLYGPFEIQGEYLNTWVRRPGEATPQFQGYYATVSYFLTGESRLYDAQAAGFVGITPIHSRYGAWQVAVRLSALDLSSQTIQGGYEHDVTVGLNWYPNQHVELLFNYIRAMMRPNAMGVYQNVNLYAFRLQIVL